jgi:arabinoxylan arabinofuranohydrolase
MKKTLISVFLSLFTATIFSQNPIVPPGVYIADPSAHVWSDGKLYVYGSRDESPDYYCSWSHHVLSTSDLKTWILHKNVFASKGPGDQVPYSDDFLYAPDVQFSNGIYYMYYTLANNTCTEGVATSSTPTGPFMNGRILKTGGVNQIDPCVFIDDDGKAYYIWGQFTAKMARLKPNMIEIDSSTIRDNIVTEKEHRFHEGGYMIKHNGIYYFVYAALSMSNMASCISYSTSSSPWGPFKYGGVIINNDHCDPGNWNNHGSLVEFNGKWYVFYHRATHGSYTMRKACLEPIAFNEDGSIDEVEMTTQGAAGPLSAFNQMDAERACLLHGNVRICANSDDNEILTGIKDGDRAAYKYMDFGKGAASVTFRIASGADAGIISIVMNNPWEKAIGNVQILGGGDGKSWTTLTVPVENVTGIHAVWLRFNVRGDSGFNVDWFVFE